MNLNHLILLLMKSLNLIKIIFLILIEFFNIKGYEAFRSVMCKKFRVIFSIIFSDGRRKHNKSNKVVLCGEGADELFGGYNFFSIKVEIC